MLKTLDGALVLLTRFTTETPTWGVRELAKATGVHPAVVHRVLATFEANGFVVKDGASRYALGLKLFELGQLARNNLSPTELVQPALDLLAQTSGETVFLLWLDGREGICIGIAHSQHQLRFSIDLGQRFALRAGAHAKAILAFMPEADRELALGHLEAAEKVKFDAQLQKIRDDGWVHTSEESIGNVAGLAIPVRAPNQGKVVGSLAIAGPLQRLGGEQVPRLLEALKTARDAIEKVTGLMA